MPVIGGLLRGVMNYNNLQIGEKIYYTGDMANLPAEGEIVERITDGWYPLTYKIKFSHFIRFY